MQDNTISHASRLVYGVGTPGLHMFEKEALSTYERKDATPRVHTQAVNYCVVLGGARKGGEEKKVYKTLASKLPKKLILLLQSRA